MGLILDFQVRVYMHRYFVERIIDLKPKLDNFRVYLDFFFISKFYIIPYPGYRVRKRAAQNPVTEEKREWEDDIKPIFQKKRRRRQTHLTGEERGRVEHNFRM